MTSGDRYPEAVALATDHRQPTAVDYRGFGELRRAEALVALESHRTRAAVMDRLFRSLARPNELFGVIEKAQLPTLKPGDPACGPELPSRPVAGTVPVAAASPIATPAAAVLPTALPRNGRAW
jgi:hypothetical protein